MAQSGTKVASEDSQVDVVAETTFEYDQLEHKSIFSTLKFGFDDTRTLFNIFVLCMGVLMGIV